jgi:hypothetical protein
LSRFFAAPAAGVATLAAVLATAATAAAAPPQVDVYRGDVSRDQLAKILAQGIDRHELEVSKGAGKDTVRVEAALSAPQVKELASEGVELEPKEIDGQTVAERATLKAAQGFEVFKHYAGPGGIKEDVVRTALRNWRIAKLVNVGRTVKGEDIVGIKLSRNAASTRDGSKPATLYIGAQHAREWITPEMNLRLMHYLVDRYDRGDKRIRRLLDENELWIVPVANPDGYEYSFTEGQRLWRKNLRDNDGSGTVTPADGVDLNRNFDYRFGYDNEGSSPDPTDLTYRGPRGNSEPENQAIDRLAKRVGFEFFVNYHSAAELLLYGIGWQVATPSPDDIIAEAMTGDDAHPAVPGYDPDIAAELYITNGDTDTYLTEKYGTLGFTPEMGTCESASDSVPDDEWEAEDCGSGFEFPDDEALVEAEFRKNIPFALAVAESASHPDDPVSVVGREAEDFRVDTFNVSYGDPQQVAVTAKRALRDLRMHYRINNGRTYDVKAGEWRGGERYGGDENDRYYAEYRGEVKGARPGDRVKVWFSGEKKDKHKRDVESAPFTYTVKQDTGAKVLVLADEDYKGVNPDYPAGTNAPRYAAAHLAAVRAAGYSADLWDLDRDGVPHDLGVLSHYKAIVWYLGDNRYTQDPEDEFIDTMGIFGPRELPDIGVAEREQYLTIAVRDFLNEGGKLVHMGEMAQDGGLLDQIVGGSYYGLNGDPTAECVITTGVQGLFDDCLILANDFRQYWLGAYTRVSLGGPNELTGIARPIEGYSALLSGTPSNPLDEAGVYQPTSDVLPVSEFPQFASQGAAQYDFTGDPFTPVEGSNYAAAVHADQSYMRLTKTVDLTGVAGSANPQLNFKLSVHTETDYDHVFVEARTPGQDNWTTLPEAGGKSQTDVPAECDDPGFLLTLHPFLRHYFQGDNCASAGSSGDWNSFTGAGRGWQDVTFDLSDYAGQQVELSITYMTDPGTGGVGVFVDDTKIIVGGAVTQADGFEGATSTWTVGGPPAGSPPNSGNWVIGPKAVNFFAGTSTKDTLLLGVGLEQVTSPADRTALMRRSLSGLGVR